MPLNILSMSRNTASLMRHLLHLLIADEPALVRLMDVRRELFDLLPVARLDELFADALGNAER